MLVLSRKAREELIFPEYGIVVTILEVHGNRVRVGIAAPKDVQVVRREIGNAPTPAPGISNLAHLEGSSVSSNPLPKARLKERSRLP